ncbi:MAG TPA: SDR family oxidoreductase [Gaiellaceae bacterium]|nr:SDR family oxidoreductase [Gaiellaceae bacterium]
MPLQTADKRALVAGGTGRLGAAIAARLAAEGWRVLAAGKADGDLATAAGARDLVDRAIAELGGLDLVVHAAGEGFVPRPVADVTEADWDTAFGATAKGTFFLAQAAAAELRARRGTLIVLEDVAAFQPWPAFAPHCAAKAAQAMLTRVLARALAPDVRVCGIAPGPVAIEPGQEERRAAETLLGRVGSADDVADAVLYLAGAGFVTGTTLVVDGGLLLQSTAPRKP